jgi:hypothetical protein
MTLQALGLNKTLKKAPLESSKQKLLDKMMHKLEQLELITSSASLIELAFSEVSSDICGAKVYPCT